MRTMMAVVCGLLLASAFLGCRQRDTGSADVRYYIFEVSRDVADSLVPPEKRTRIDDSFYAFAFVPSESAASLFNGQLDRPEVLIDRSRRIAWWPNVADSWSYSKAGKLLGGGGGSGFLGVRFKKGGHEFRVDYKITHGFNTANPIDSRIFYQGRAPEGDFLVFLAPVKRDDETKLTHVIAFETSNWQ